LKDCDTDLPLEGVIPSKFKEAQTVYDQDGVIIQEGRYALTRVVNAN